MYFAVDLLPKEHPFNTKGHYFKAFTLSGAYDLRDGSTKELWNEIVKLKLVTKAKRYFRTINK